MKMICITCSTEIISYLSQKRKYCSVKCQNEQQYKDYIAKWLSGEVTGMRGKTSTSAHIRKYIFEKYDSKCCECGWSKINPFSQTLPLELEHIDGNFMNNKEENLKLLCPSCHSLTETYKGANKKIGRPRAKYYRGT